MRIVLTVIITIAAACAGIMCACLAAISKKYSRVEEEEDLRMAAEKNYENRIKDYLQEQRCWFIKYWGGGGFTRSGIPDLLVCINGFFVGIEVKADRGRPSDLQLRQLRQIRKAGGIAILLYPDDFGTFKTLVSALKSKDGMVIKALTAHMEEKEKRYYADR